MNEGEALPPRHPDAPPPGARIPSHFHLCFGCGSDHPTGLHLVVTADEGLAVTTRFAVTEAHQGAPGLAHGGLLATAFDETLGALAFLLHRSVVTAHLETDFRRPVPVGSVLFIRAEVIGVEGRRVQVRASGRLDAADGPVAVQAKAVFVEVPLEHFFRYGRSQDVQAASARDEVKAYARHFEVNP